MSRNLIILSIAIILTISMPISMAEEDETVNNTPTSNITELTPEDIKLAPLISLISLKTTVNETERAIITLSIINPVINNVNINADLNLKIPSDAFLVESTFVQTQSDNTVHSIHELEPGAERHIQIGVISNKVGTFNITSKVTYYFGEDEKNAVDYTLSLPINVSEKMDVETNPIIETALGFGLIFVLSAFLLVWYFKTNN